MILVFFGGDGPLISHELMAPKAGTEPPVDQNRPFESSAEDELFSKLLSLDQDRRSEELDRIGLQDPSMRQRLEKLLAALIQAGDFLEAPASAASELRPEAASLPIGTVIDRFKLLELIGEGGFGVVYRAEQLEPVRREVALKIIKVGMDTKQVIARFEAERQVLAMMDHAGIAKVFDAGATETGRPYFVMELVKGMPITEYCDLHDVSMPGRLDLFINVCQAVQHAHQKGVIHRDLKPSNVLVTREENGESTVAPEVKIIDFGIAKATHQRMAEQTMFTEHGQFIGTPTYMSPEQAEPEAVDIDTRSDIYSLGVLLYELLTGTTPFDTNELRAAAFYEIQRIIREKNPPKPSTRLSTMGGPEIADVARHRGAEPQRLARQLRGDLDWIIMMALEKDRTRRYETANGLAQDIRRYLADEPVLAGPPTASYRLRKLIKRNKWPFAAAAVITLLLVAGVTGTTLSMMSALRNAVALDTALVDELKQRKLAESNEIRAEAEAFEANRQAEIARAINDFLNQDLLASVAPSGRPGEGRDVLMREVLDAAAVSLDEAACEGGRFADKPLVEAAVRGMLGETYWRLGEHEKAEPHLERSLELIEREQGETHEDTGVALSRLGNLYQGMSRYDEAAELYRRAIQVRRELFGDEHRATLNVMVALSRMQRSQGNFAESQLLIEEARVIAERLLEPDDNLMLNILSHHAGLLKDLTRFDEAISIWERTLEIRRNADEPNAPDISMNLNALAILYKSTGQLDRAAEYYAQALDMQIELFSERHPATLATMTNFGKFQSQRGELEDAERIMTRSLQLHREVLGDHHRGTLITQAETAVVYRKLKRYDDAESLYLEAITLAKEHYSPDFIYTLSFMNDLAVLYDEIGRHEQALELIMEVVDRAVEALGADHLYLGYYLRNRAKFQQKLDHFDKAEADLTRAFEIMQTAIGIDNGETQYVVQQLVNLYETWHSSAPEAGHEAQAVEWKNRLVTPAEPALQKP